MKSLVALLGIALSNAAISAQDTYVLDPAHTFPSFEADHMGISIWRGKFNTNSGQVTLDKSAGKGTVEVTVDMASVDFGHDKLNEWARSVDFFDVPKHPFARYSGTLESFVNGARTKVQGSLTMNGVTKPVTLTINSFKCIPHPLVKRELCGADASGAFYRDEFGLTAGKDYGFKMEVMLRIQVEALKVE